MKFISEHIHNNWKNLGSMWDITNQQITNQNIAFPLILSSITSMYLFKIIFIFILYTIKSRFFRVEYPWNNDFDYTWNLKIQSSVKNKS